MTKGGGSGSRAAASGELFNAFPDLNNAIFKYDAEIISPDSHNWETSTKVESSRWARWEKPGMVLRTAASPLDADELRAMVARFCHDGDVDITYEEFAVVVAEPPEKPAAPPPRGPALRCAACKRKLGVPNRCSRCRAARVLQQALLPRGVARPQTHVRPAISPISGGSETTRDLTGGKQQKEGRMEGGKGRRKKGSITYDPREFYFGR